MDYKPRIGDIAFWIVGAFMCGIFAISAQWNIPLSSGIFLVFLIALLSIYKQWHAWKYAVLVFSAVIIGIGYYRIYNRWSASYTHIPSGKQIAFFGFITDEPKPAGNFLMFPLHLSQPYRGTIDVFTSINARFHYGDFIWIKGMVENSKDPQEDPIIFLPQSSVITSNNGFWLKSWSIKTKNFISSIFTHFFSANNAALLSGVVLGTTSALNTSLKAQMNDSGTSYIIGMYGYKIAMISAALKSLLKDHIPKKHCYFLLPL